MYVYIRFSGMHFVKMPFYKNYLLNKFIFKRVLILRKSVLDLIETQTF